MSKIYILCHEEYARKSCIKFFFTRQRKFWSLTTICKFKMMKVKYEHCQTCKKCVGFHCFELILTISKWKKVVWTGSCFLAAPSAQYIDRNIFFPM